MAEAEPGGDAAGEPVEEDFLASLTDTSLYSIGAYFADRHPDLVEDVITQSEDIEREGITGYAEREGVGLETTFQTLVTGLAVRYYKAVAGSPGR